jgi:hypothetical protein
MAIQGHGTFERLGLSLCSQLMREKFRLQLNLDTCLALECFYFSLSTQDLIWRMWSCKNCSLQGDYRSDQICIVYKSYLSEVEA